MTADQQQLILYTTEDGKVSIALFAQDGTVWMNQQQLAELFATSKQNVSFHIQNILKDWELSQNSVVKNYLTTDIEGWGFENVKNRLIPV